jgi:site-specific recombinase XerD
MPSIRAHTTASGSTTHTVLYRHGGKQTSKSFDNPAGAARFKSLVDNLGPAKAEELLSEERQPPGITLDQLAEDWLAWKARDVQPRTLVDYRRDYDNWIRPFLGHRAAASITEADVQTWVDRDLSRRLGAKSIADRHALLHGIYKWGSARARGRVPRNPCTETELPKRRKGAPKGLTMPEWAGLLEAARILDADAADLILFMGSTGWRIGEATALTVQGVEDYGDDRAWLTMYQVQRKGEGITQGGKSTAALRRVDVWGDCLAMLRSRVVGKGPADLVFTNDASPTGLWEPSTFRKRYWAKAVKAAGLAERHPTPHWLRHTHVAICHAAGMSLAEIQRRIGHEDIKTTINTYGRMLGDTPDDVMAKMDTLISGRGLPVVGEVVRGEVEAR